jgi:small subunit ribosomal protein S18
MSERREGGPRRRSNRKVCTFCAERIDYIDYKEVSRLRRFLSERGKILPRRITGTCAKHQRPLTDALKRARSIALLPYTTDTVR